MTTDNKGRGDLYLLLTLVTMIIICITFNISLFFGFLTSIIISLIFLAKKGFSYNHQLKIMWEGIKECRILYLLILLIGAAVSVWMASGVVPAMMYYGFQYMKGMNFLLAVFLITSLISLFMGTAVGTISTIGIALLGVGKGFGVPDALILGAAVSGSFIADKIAPTSGLLNLILSTTGTTYRSTIKSMLKTLIPVYMLTCLSYYILGNIYSVNIDPNIITEYQQSITQGFNISPLLLLIPIGVLVMSLCGIKIIPTVFSGITAGILVSVALQGISASRILYSIFFGYHASTQSDTLNSILISGGVKSMLEVLLIVASVVALVSLLNKTDMLKPIFDSLFINVTSKRNLIIKTGIMSSLLTIITCDQTVGIILPGKLLKEKYSAFNLKSEVLARTISDTGTIIAPLMPWNVNGLIISMITGISAVQYAPYSVLCFLFPIITMGAAFMIRRVKISTPQFDI